MPHRSWGNDFPCVVMTAANQGRLGVVARLARFEVLNKMYFRCCDTSCDSSKRKMSVLFQRRGHLILPESLIIPLGLLSWEPALHKNVRIELSRIRKSRHSPADGFGWGCPDLRHSSGSGTPQAYVCIEGGYLSGKMVQRRCYTVLTYRFCTLSTSSTASPRVEYRRGQRCFEQEITIR